MESVYLSICFHFLSHYLCRDTWFNFTTAQVPFKHCIRSLQCLFFIFAFISYRSNHIYDHGNGHYHALKQIDKFRCMPQWTCFVPPRSVSGSFSEWHIPYRSIATTGIQKTTGHLRGNISETFLCHLAWWLFRLGYPSTLALALAPNDRSGAIHAKRLTTGAETNCRSIPLCCIDFPLALSPSSALTKWWSGISGEFVINC